MFYDRFIDLCAKVGKAPSAVAEAVGMSGAHVNRWKNGSNPTDITVQKLARYFGVKPSYFSFDALHAEREDLQNELMYLTSEYHATAESENRDQIRKEINAKQARLDLVLQRISEEEHKKENPATQTDDGISDIRKQFIGYADRYSDNELLYIMRVIDAAMNKD